VKGIILDVKSCDSRLTGTEYVYLYAVSFGISLCCKKLLATSTRCPRQPVFFLPGDSYITASLAAKHAQDTGELHELINEKCKSINYWLIITCACISASYPNNHFNIHEIVSCLPAG
jgi:hypothetical protein